MAAPVPSFPHERVWPPLILGAFALAWLPPALRPAWSCPFHALTGLPCLSCGGTRALSALAHLELAQAFAMNPLVATLGLCSLLYVAQVISARARGRAPWRLRREGRALRWLRLLLPAAAISSWAYLLAVGR